MRLRRIALTHVAGVAQGELVVPTEGPCVVHAPNEQGKSTLFRAYRLIVEGTKHRSKAQNVKALQTLRADVGTTVELELILGDETHHVVRTFNRGVGSSLTVTGPSGTRIMKGDEADEHLADRIAAHVDAALHGLLTLEQGRTLDPLEVGGSRSVEAALRAADADDADGADGPSGAGGAGASAGDAVLEAVRGRVKAAFHAKTGKPIGELKKLLDRVESARTRRDEAEAALAAARGDAEDAVDAVGRTEALRAEVAALDAELALARQAEQVARATAEADLASDRLTTRRTLIAGVAALAEKEQQQRATVAELTGKRDAAATALAAAEESAGKLARARAELVAAVAQAEADLLAALDATVAALRTDLAEERVDAAAAKQVDRLERAIDIGRAAVRGGAWTLTVEARRDVRLTVDGAPLDVAAGSSHTGEVASGVTFTDADGTVVTVEADAERRERVAALAADEAELAALLERLGAADADAVTARLAARVDVEERIGEHVARATGIRDEREERDAGPLPPARADAGTDVAELEEALDAAVAALDAHGGGERDVVAAATAAVQQAQAVLDAQTETLAARVAEREKAEQELTAARATTPDADLEAGAEAAAAALAQARRDGDGRPGDVAALESRRTAVVAELDGLERRAHERAGQQRSAAAFEAALDSAKRVLAEEESDWDRAHGEAAAAKRLLDRLEVARTAQGDRYRDPLIARIGALLTELYGHPCRVEIDPDLRITARSDPDGTMIPWDQLSGGAREQAAIATGIAIAELAASGDGGVPFWIDDAIVFTDDVRLEGLKQLLAATTAQVIVLTCRPELAEGLPTAAFTRTRG